MASSAALTARIRDALTRRRGITEQRMFGGTAFLLNKHLLVGVWQEGLVVRLGPPAATRALQQPHVRQFDVTGRPMRGWVIVDPEGMDDDHQLRGWIDQALEFVRTLPPK